MATDNFDKHNPLLLVEVVEDNGIWTAECKRIGMVAEADSYDSVQERVWEIAPELAKLSGLDFTEDSLRLRFQFDGGVSRSYNIKEESWLNITFDPHKDTLNQRDHGISLREAEQFEWETFICEEDDRFAYGEMRLTGYGYIGRVLYRLTYVEYDDENWRAISLRAANKHEMRKYAEA